MTTKRRCICGLPILEETGRCRAACPRRADKKPPAKRFTPEKSKERGFNTAKSIADAAKRLGISDDIGWRGRSVTWEANAANRKKRR